MEQKDSKTIHYKAHLIAGSLSSFMFIEGIEHAKDLENLALGGHVDALPKSANKLILYLENVLNFISKNYEIS